MQEVGKWEMRESKNNMLTERARRLYDRSSEQNRRGGTPTILPKIPLQLAEFTTWSFDPTIILP